MLIYIYIFFCIIFQKSTDLSISQQYPTLSCSVPVYNFLFDRLEDEYDKRKKEKGAEDVVVKALEASKKKIKSILCIYNWTNICSNNRQV